MPTAHTQHTVARAPRKPKGPGRPRGSRLAEPQQGGVTASRPASSTQHNYYGRQAPRYQRASWGSRLASLIRQASRRQGVTMLRRPQTLISDAGNARQWYTSYIYTTQKYHVENSK
eukprot:361147-Pyramimonas_sp.AAC.1